jgi:hypothetical protein
MKRLWPEIMKAIIFILVLTGVSAAEEGGFEITRTEHGVAVSAGT